MSHEWQLVNKQKPIWMRNPEEITKVPPPASFLVKVLFGRLILLTGAPGKNLHPSLMRCQARCLLKSKQTL